MEDQIDWEVLCWRVVKWEYIPADSRERVVTFLTVPENVALNNAMTWHKDEDSEDGMRNQLIKSHVGKKTKIPAFDTYPFTDKNNFEGLRWVMKAGIELQGLELSLTAGEVVSDSVTEADSVLWHLVDRRMADIAELYTTKSSKAKDTTHFCEELEEEVPTLTIAAHRGYVDVVRSLMKKGANMDRTISQGRTPLYIASYNGHLEVVEILIEGGAHINRANNNGYTPLYIAKQCNRTKVIELLESAAAAQV